MTDEPEVENPFDLTQYVNKDDYPVGCLAAIKVIKEDGKPAARFIIHEMSTYEAVGILQAYLDHLRQECLLDLYPVDDSTTEDEDG